MRKSKENTAIAIFQQQTNQLRHTSYKVLTSFILRLPIDNSIAVTMPAEEVPDDQLDGEEYPDGNYTYD